jgi:hypothetical protein
MVRMDLLVQDPPYLRYWYSHTEAHCAQELTTVFIFEGAILLANILRPILILSFKPPSPTKLLVEYMEVSSLVLSIQSLSQARSQIFQPVAV